MRLAIGAGGVALLAGVAGMFVWIHDGSNYFGVAVALATAGFLTLVACVLTQVFGSSHGSQDDAFRRGRSMGYDAGFLEGHRTARPVVVPLHVVGGRDLETPVSHLDRAGPLGPLDELDEDHADEPDAPTAIIPVWRRETQHQVAGWDRALGWVGARRTPLAAGALGLALLGVLTASALARTPVPAEALQLSPGDLFHRAVPPSQALPALVPETTPLVSAAGGLVGAAGSAAVAAGGAGVGGVDDVADVDGVGAGGAVAANGGAGVNGAVRAGRSGSAGGSGAVGMQPGGAGGSAEPVAAEPGSLGGPVLPGPLSQPGAVVAAPAVAYLPPVTRPAGTTTTAVEPVVAAPAVPLTAAEQTAADAEAAAALTAANAAAAADLTAANAAAAAAQTAADAEAAAALTAANAAAAAAATAQAAEDAAWATAHPQT